MMISPFKFLDAYTREDRAIFFGRDREIEELYQKVFESKILLVYGISGTGKTSLINCGLANKFAESDWLPIHIRRGKDINESLVSEIQKESITRLKEDGSIQKAIQSVYLDHFKPVYLIFDQFEEVFIFGDRQERDEFSRTIAELIHSDIQCKCLFSIREEYLAHITEFEQIIDNILDNRIRVEKMTRTHATEAIEGPCRVQAIELEEGFAEKLLDKLSPESNEIELTFLQVFLDRILRMSSHEGDGMTFTNAMIGQVGDVSDLLGDFLEEQIKELKDPDAGMTLLKAFVSIKGTKRQVEETDIEDYVRALGKSIPLEEIKVLIQKFINLRILRDKDESGRYELRHDSLAAKIYESITMVEKELLEIREFIENAFEIWQKRGIFLDKTDLEYIAPYEKRLYLDGKLKEFIDKCRRSLEAKKRSFQRILFISATGFLLTLSAVAIYSFRYSFSLKAQKLARLSNLQRGFSLPMSYHSAKAAYEKDSVSSLAAKALFDSFYDLLEGGPYHDSLGNLLYPGKMIFDFTPAESKIEEARFSEDGSLIYGYLDNGTVKAWNLEGRQVFSKEDSSRRIVDVVVSPDNRCLAAIYCDSLCRIWRMAGDSITEIKIGFEPLSPGDALSFSTDSRTFAITGTENQICFYDTAGRFLYELTGHTGEITGISFSPDSQYMASSSKDSSVLIWKWDNDTSEFRRFRRLREWFEGEVWAVDFALNSRWILCVSNKQTYETERDSILTRFGYSGHILDFNGSGKSVFHFSTQTANYPWALSKPVYDANFTSEDAAIVYNTLKTDSAGKDFKNECVPEYRVEFSESSRVGSTPRNKNLERYYFNRDFDFQQHKMDGVDVSVHSYIASSIAGIDLTNLFYADQIPIRKFNGSKPHFSPDGDYLLCIKANELALYPVSENKIIELVEEQKIFGVLVENKSDWRHYYN